MRTSIITAATALCALGITGFVPAVSGAVQPRSVSQSSAAARSPGADAACATAAWPYAPAVCARSLIDPAQRPVRVIAIDSAPAGLARP